MIDSAVREMTVLFSTAAAVLAAVWIARRPLDPRPASSPRWYGVLFHPLAQLGFVIGLLFVNQILFNAYVLQAHHGDPSFIGRYIGQGWFVLRTHDPIVRFVASHCGNGEILAPSVLRVQAFLELPFTLFAYLAVARMLGRDLFRTLCRWPLLLAASLSFTITFSIVEIRLWNPYTIDDLVLRAIACVVVPPYVAWIARRLAAHEPSEAGRPTGALAMIAFLAGAAAIAAGVLVVYDVFLLYNLGHLGARAHSLAIAAAVAFVAAYAAPRLARRPSLVGETIVTTLASFTTLFFVPSLSLRYWGNHPLALIAGLFVVIAGAAWGLDRARKLMESPRDAFVVFLALANGVVVGLLFSLAVGRQLIGESGEAVLAGWAIGFLGGASIVAFGVERVALALIGPATQSVRR